jgi:hypothetical protein
MASRYVSVNLRPADAVALRRLVLDIQALAGRRVSTSALVAAMVATADRPSLVAALSPMGGE